MRSPAVHLLTESGEGIGFGHLSRMNVVASELVRRGIACSKWCHHVGGMGNPLLDGWENVAWREAGALKILEGAGSAAVVDSYLAAPCDYNEVAIRCHPVLAIDDFDRLDYPVDLVVNPNPQFEGGNETKRCGGSQYVLIRDAFRHGQRRRCVSDRVAKVLVTVGGDDPHGLLPQLLELLRGWTGKIVVLAGNETRRVRLSAVYGSPSREIEAALPAEKVHAHFLACDFVVSACGQTLHELAYMEIPAIGIRTGEDQRGNQDFYLSHGFLGREIAVDQPDWSDGFLREWTEMLAQDYRYARVASIEGVIDGRGGERFVDLLLKQMDHAPGRARLCGTRNECG